MKNICIQVFLVNFCIFGTFSLNDKAENNDHPKSTILHRQKRHNNYNYNNVDQDYPQYQDYYYHQPPPYSSQPNQQAYDPSALRPLAFAGSAGLALKALKTKSVLKLLKLPVGLAVAGGAAALAASLIPPAVIGSINLPFQVSRSHVGSP
ncbi:hypothetical protein JTE90_024901 [Oedothorax gibbosus]|uniref:Uncharacterized protein n=1 Tax=Oedothorax gibbosus TaxID=931172 RepID=A0AAV6U4C1_9ARAC|nr:hypothetical protein JTE90_024901 [Oedothorax gibbosus]